MQKRSGANKATYARLCCATMMAAMAAMTLACGDDAPSSLHPSLQSVAQQQAQDLHIDRAGQAPGTYTLHPQGSDALCLAVERKKKSGATDSDAAENAEPKDEDGARVEVHKCDGSAGQQWVRSGEMFRVLGNKCLNLRGGSNRNGARLQIWGCNDRDINFLWNRSGNQLQWKKNPKLCMDVVDGELRDGTDVQVWTCDSKAENVNQLWKFVASSPVPSQATSAKPAAQPIAQAKNNTAPTASVASKYALVGPSPAGLDVAPYFWTWAQWGDYLVRTLKEGVQKVDLKSATVSFELSNHKCAPQGAFAAMGDDIKAFRKAGRRVILSYGGAGDNPPYLQKACQNATELANVIAKQMDTYDTHFLDFDIEGDNLGDVGSNNRLVDALYALQSRYPDLYVSYTLPVDAYSGMPSTAIAILQRSIGKKVRVSRVNLMTMDYGQMPPHGKSSADMVIGSVEAAVQQLKKLYVGVDEKTIYHMIGITPLIGQNDPPGSGSFYFTVSDAQATAKYAKEKGIGLLSYWGLMRDRSGSSSSNANHSNTPQKDFAFLNTFRAAQ